MYTVSKIQSLCRSVTNFDLNYLRTGRIDCLVQKLPRLAPFAGGIKFVKQICLISQWDLLSQDRYKTPQLCYSSTTDYICHRFPYENCNRFCSLQALLNVLLLTKQKWTPKAFKKCFDQKGVSTFANIGNRPQGTAHEEQPIHLWVAPYGLPPLGCPLLAKVGTPNQNKACSFNISF